MSLANTDNASGNYVDVGNAAILNDNTEGSVCGWIYPTTVANAFRNVMGKSTTGGGWELAKLGADGTRLIFLHYRTTTNLNVRTTTGQLAANTWHFFGVSWDLNTSGNCRSCIGRLNALAADTTDLVSGGAGAANTDAGINLRLMANAIGTAGWPGRVARLQLFDRVLSLAEFQALQFGAYQNPTGLIGAWEMGFGGLSSLPDLSGNGNNGSFTGALTLDEHVPLVNPFAWHEEGDSYAVAAFKSAWARGSNSILQPGVR
jgi:hypothetical protein